MKVMCNRLIWLVKDVTDLFIFVPGQGLWSEHKPVVTWTALHDAQIGDGHVAATNHLIAQFATLFACILRRSCGATGRTINGRERERKENNKRALSSLSDYNSVECRVATKKAN